jgi:type VI secretion system protein ImpA
MEMAAQPGEERQIGEEVIAAHEPNYREVADKAIAVLERSHDLRAAGNLALAKLRLNGLPGFAEVTGYVRGCVEEYWDTCHPQLDAEDDNDPTMRVNAVRGLADADGLLRAIRLAPLTESRAHGRFSLRDIAIAEGEIPAPPGMNPVPEAGAIAAAFEDTDPALLQEVYGAAQAAAADVDAIAAKFDMAVPGLGPDLDPLAKLLRQIAKRMASSIGGTLGEEPGTADMSDGSVGAGPISSRGGGALGGISGPGDVINSLDRIMDYYARHEPSSPIPILLARAKRLVNADFMTIVRDMAPSGVDNVSLIGGLPDESY